MEHSLHLHMRNIMYEKSYKYFVNLLKYCKPHGRKTLETSVNLFYGSR